MIGSDRIVKPGARWLFVSDVDDTLLGDDDALLKLSLAIEKASDKLIFAFNSSRPCSSQWNSINQNRYLPTPDLMIGALGTEIQIGASREPISAYADYIDHDWDREKVAKIAKNLNLAPHDEDYQTAFKASFDIENDGTLPRVIEDLKRAGLVVKVIFSGQKNLDIIPNRAGKGEAIHFLGRHLGIQPSHVVVAGDSGNDIEMFSQPRKGIIVGNADRDLKKLDNEDIYHASTPYAQGVLEGLLHWGVLS